MNKEGLIYILSNPSFREGLIKIGRTTRSAEERAWEIYVQATGVPEKFKVEHREFTFNCIAAEEAIHEKLKKYRVNEFREFFDLDIEEAIETIRQEVHAINSQTSTRPKPVVEKVIVREIHDPISTPEHIYQEVYPVEATARPTELTHQLDPAQRETKKSFISGDKTAFFIFLISGLLNLYVGFAVISSGRASIVGGGMYLVLAAICFLAARHYKGNY